MTWENLSDVLARLASGAPPPPWAGLFGASPRPADCQLVLIPVPWDATVSYGDGTAAGPDAVVRASHQLDLEDDAFVRPYTAGITMLPVDEELRTLNAAARQRALAVIDGDAEDRDLAPARAFVNAASATVNARVRALAEEHLREGRLVGVVGGDHSSPFGLLAALGERWSEGFGVLHIDAHHDLRQAYAGFDHSHASIMHNVLRHIPAVRPLVQVAIRDYSADERALAVSLEDRVRVYYGSDLFRRKARGESWAKVTADIVAALPERVYVSFDIDGLDAPFCPSTGTPVPGGLAYDEALFLLEELAKSGRRIIGFDLCEVAPAKDGSEWDANVGARVLYKLCGATLHSQGLCPS